MALTNLTRGSDRTADFEGAVYKKRADFFFGATLTAGDQVLLWSSERGGDGNYYLWSGAYPKVVPPGATPATSGGIGASAWGLAPSSSKVVVAASVAALKLLPPALAGAVQTLGYYAAGDRGAGLYRYDSTDTTSADNGGTVIVGLGGARWKLDNDGEVSLRQFGCKIDFATDDTAAMIKAVAWAANPGNSLVHPGGICKLTATINLPGSFRLKGVGVDPGYRVSMGAQTKYGSFFYLAHTGKGFVLSPTTTGQANTNGVRFYDFGTIRNHPNVVSGWAPTDHDWDFHVTGYGSTDYINILALNATRAFYNEHRANFLGCRGQAFKAFIFIDNNYDTVRIDNCHQWPFWNETSIPMDYSRANLQCYTFLRSDNPMMSNSFSYAHKYGIYFGLGAGGGPGPTGVTSRFKGNNLDFDAGYYGVYCQTDGVTAQFTDISLTGWTATSGSIGVFSQGLGNTLEFKGLRVTNANDQAIYVEGNNNGVKVTDLWVDAWNTGNTNKPAVSCSSAAFFESTNPPRILKSQGNGAALLGGNGQFRVNGRKGLTAAATSNGAGQITVTHNNEFDPNVIVLQSYNVGKFGLAVTGHTDTTFTATLFDTSTGSALPSTSVGFAWETSYVQ
ncbi:hypothetical protein [Pseudomonas juntendi]|uniref:tail fiber/spike domain-containing protein n=1 Tax=Pseudomonas juntendi TaxID=2666183 RepID=UPI001E619419|nr:hypothetical protein [Pseudomonas juntendi]MDM3889681.1 hypothetical protein [Pseudomonas juntendi]